MTNGTLHAARWTVIGLRTHLVILLAAAPLVPVLQAAESAWPKRADISYPTGNLSMQTGWDPARGLHLRVTDTKRSRTLTISINTDGVRVKPEPPDAFSTFVRDSTQFNPAALPAAAAEKIPLLIKFRPELWAIYLDGRPVTVFPAPFLPPASLRQPEAEWPPEGKRRTRYQKVAHFEFHDDFLVPEDDDNQLASWEIESGHWRLHSAEDLAAERGVRNDGKRKTLQAVRSSNFYSLKGSGTNAIITTGHYFYDRVNWETAVRAGTGEAGLIFHFDDTDSYYGFTVTVDKERHIGLVRLFRVTPDKGRRLLGAVQTTLTEGQWLKLGVQTYISRIQCSVDGQVVLDVQEELPPGGCIGLFADGPGTGHFDDTRCVSNHDLDLASLSGIRRYTVHEHGRFFPKKKRFSYFARPNETTALRPPSSKTRQWLAVGAPLHGPHVFAADFHVASAQYEIGLIAGFTERDKPYYAYTSRALKNGSVMTLERVTGDEREVLERFRLHRDPGRLSKRVQLMIDATQGPELRMYRNDRMVLVHYPEQEVVGASGVTVGPSTSCVISNLTYRFTRPDVYRNLSEKNQIFMADPFMRNWSSPEGQWLPATNGLTWHKGDFYGRFQMRAPLVVDSEIHMSVREGQTNGQALVRIDGDNLFLHTPAPGDTMMITTVGTGRVGTDVTTQRVFNIHHDGYWLWVTSGDAMLAQHALERPLQGRRMRVSGFSTDDLKHSDVHRYNVKDYLFTESLHEWTQNGGLWEVVNRFQCDVRWSHMNGESAKTTAALWSKYAFEGDFCVEMYAGMRHGWYARPGDLNLSVMGSDNSPGSGYTVTCTGWDFDHSQQFTRLYRDGEIIAESDKYLVPRTREGTTRRGYNPLLRSGRPVHGAWYYIKFRRAGKMLEYFFDNELVFRTEDDSPIPAGSLGVWTYRNSMMVARVKIGAENISRARRTFSPATGVATRPPPANTHSNIVSTLRLNRGQVALMDRNLWTASNTVSRTRFTWHKDRDGQPYFALRNTLGGGAMQAQLDGVGTELAKTTGWRFYIKRTPKAQFNFHYALGSSNGKTFTPTTHFVHRISGTDFAKGRHRISGSSDVAPIPRGGEDWHHSGDWVGIDVPLPPDVLRRTAKGLFVKVLGFGNLQPSYVQQGLAGNRAGDAYAVKGLHVVGDTQPVFSLAVGEKTMRNAVTIHNAATNQAHLTFTNLVQLNHWVAGITNEGAHTFALRIHLPDRDRHGMLSWRTPPQPGGVTVRWSDTEPDRVIFDAQAGNNHRAFLNGRATLDDHALALETTTGNTLAAWLPRTPSLTASSTNAMHLEFTFAGIDYPLRLEWGDGRVNAPPVLLKLTGGARFLFNLESRKLGPPLEAQPARMSLAYDQERQGVHLHVRNGGTAQRLHSRFVTDGHAARYPVFQYRYRGRGMVRISLTGGDSQIAINEPGAKLARPARHAEELVLDGGWHTWLGQISDGRRDSRLGKISYNMPTIAFGSRAAHDQTGLYSEWWVDDLVLGLAVTNAHALKYAPQFHDVDGVDVVMNAVLAGPASAYDLDAVALDKLKWTESKNGVDVLPSLAGLTNGIHHLVLRARDRKGALSPVTDIPFLLDRTPLTISHTQYPAPGAMTNGATLRIAFESYGLSPLDPQELTFHMNNKKVTFRSKKTMLRHTNGQDVIDIAWPLVLREHLRQRPQDGAHTLRISGIRDGAGNMTPDASISIPIDLTKDVQAPSFLASAFPSNIYVRSAWEITKNNHTVLAAAKGTVLHLKRNGIESPYLAMYSKGDSATIGRATTKPAWKIAQHPYIAFRARRPAYSALDKSRIFVDFKLAGEQKFRSLELSKTKEQSEKLFLPDAVNWEADTWHPVLIDMRSLAAGWFEEDSIEDLLTSKEGATNQGDGVGELLIEHVRIRTVHATTKQPLHIQSFSIFSSWNAADQVIVDAYDASGIRDLKMEADLSTRAFEIAPAALGASDSSWGWLTVRARDWAGHYSVPIHIPVSGANLPLTPVQLQDQAKLKKGPRRHGG